MPKKSLLGAVTLTVLATIVSCDTDQSPTGGGLGTDCPIGTFRPEGLADCVFPADDQFGNLLGVSDNRCVSGQPALPPACVSDGGARPYFSLTKTCAAGYRFAPGACQRGDTGNTGASGFSVTTGAAGTGITGAGAFAGFCMTDTAGAGGTGTAGFAFTCSGLMTGAAGASAVTGAGGSQP